MHVSNLLTLVLRVLPFIGFREWLKDWLIEKLHDVHATCCTFRSWVESYRSFNRRVLARYHREPGSHIHTHGTGKTVEFSDDGLSVFFYRASSFFDGFREVSHTHGLRLYGASRRCMFVLTPEFCLVWSDQHHQRFGGTIPCRFVNFGGFSRLFFVLSLLLVN